MKKSSSWEGVILFFAISVTALTMLAYRFMITYNISIPWFAWVAIVLFCALVSFGPRFLRREH
jgi:hypothetical protein